MILQENDKKIEYLFDFFHKNPKAEVKMIFKSYIIEKAILDTMYESNEDNDEYNIILMRNIEDNTLFEISYHNIPLHVFYNGEEIK